MTRGLSQRAHNKVLEAAVELFANRGIEKTSVDAIAAAPASAKPRSTSIGQTRKLSVSKFSHLFTELMKARAKKIPAI